MEQVWVLVGSGVRCGDFVRGFRSLRRSFAYCSESPFCSGDTVVSHHSAVETL